MKATGIIRRIDDLGRIVIPKSVRQQYRVREGDPLEIYIGDDGITFKRYSELTFQSSTLTAARVLEQQLGLPVLICDRSVVLASSQSFGSHLKGPLSDELEHYVRERKEYMHSKDEAGYSPVNDQHVQPVLAMMPIKTGEGAMGGIVVLQNPDSAATHDHLMGILRVAAGILRATIDSD